MICHRSHPHECHREPHRFRRADPGSHGPRLNNTAQPNTDVQAFISAQQELAGKLGETITKGSLELIEIARESQGEAFDLFTRQATEVAEQTKDVVEKAKKSAAKG